MTAERRLCGRLVERGRRTPSRPHVVTRGDEMGWDGSGEKDTQLIRD